MKSAAHMSYGELQAELAKAKAKLELCPRPTCREVLEALIVVQNADDDCALDGLPTIPKPVRAMIDSAIQAARGE